MISVFMLHDIVIIIVIIEIMRLSLFLLLQIIANLKNGS
jgi:hypothetical protein